MRDDEGPVADAAVHVHVLGINPFTERLHDRFRTRTDAAGRFEFPDLPYAHVGESSAS